MDIVCSSEHFFRYLGFYLIFEETQFDVADIFTKIKKKSELGIILTTLFPLVFQEKFNDYQHSSTSTHILSHHLMMSANPLYWYEYHRPKTISYRFFHLIHISCFQNEANRLTCITKLCMSIYIVQIGLYP